jgi:hypothetical protein
VATPHPRPAFNLAESIRRFGHSPRISIRLAFTIRSAIRRWRRSRTA